MSDSDSEYDCVYDNGEREEREPETSELERENQPISSHYVARNSGQNRNRLRDEQHTNNSIDNKKRLVYRVKKNDVNNCDSSELRHLYSIDGQTKVRYISQSLIKERLNAYTQVKSVPKSDEQHQKQSQQDDQEIVYRRRPRYFDDLLKDEPHRKVTKCFRCGKQGHVSATCLQEKNQIKCFYCLKNHHCNMCQSSVFCNRCGETNHIEYECDTKKILRCEKCRRKGHIESDCGVIQFQKTGKNERTLCKQYDLDKVDRKDLMNLRCLDNCTKQYEHFSCYKIDLTKPSPYSTAQIQEKDKQTTTQIEAAKESEGDDENY